MTELRKQQLRTPETLKVLGAKFPKAWTVWVDGVEHLALVALETIAPGDERWHISVSTEDAVPHWNAMAAIAHDLHRRPPPVVVDQHRGALPASVGAARPAPDRAMALRASGR
jgi:hypothetical protein